MGGKKKEEILRQNQLPGSRNARLVSGVCFRDASASLWRCLLPLLRSGWVCAPRCSPPLSTVIGHILGTGAVGKQRQQSNWAMLSLGWIWKKKRVEVEIVDVIKAWYAAEPNHQIQVGTCAGTDLIAGNMLYEKKKKVAVVNTDMQAAPNLDQYVQMNNTSYTHRLAYAVDLSIHDPVSIVLITVNTNNINQSCRWRQNTLVAQ